VLPVIFGPTVLVEQHVPRRIDARHARGGAGHVGHVWMRLLRRLSVRRTDLRPVGRRREAQL
jgi:hypothetical protein